MERVKFPFCNHICLKCFKKNSPPDDYDVTSLFEQLRNVDSVTIGGQCFEPLCLDIFIRTIWLAEALVREGCEVTVRTNGTIDIGPAAFLPVHYHVVVRGPSVVDTSRYVSGAFAHLLDKDKVTIVIRPGEEEFAKNFCAWLKELRCQAPIEVKGGKGHGTQ